MPGEPLGVPWISGLAAVGAGWKESCHGGGEPWSLRGEEQALAVVPLTAESDPRRTCHKDWVDRASVPPSSVRNSDDDPEPLPGPVRSAVADRRLTCRL